MIDGIILDLDGTVYCGERAVPGAIDFVEFLRRRGVPFLFATNRANRTPAEVAAQLRGYGLSCGEDDVLTSSQATAAYLERGSAYCVGERGLEEALTAQGLRITDDAPDYVVVGFDRGFTYAKLEIACRLIGGGARFIATNADKALKTEAGLAPGTGSIVAAVAAGSGVEPVIIGKPQPLLMQMAARRLGLPAAGMLAVGDNLATDIVAGARAGMRTVLLLTGVSSRADVEGSSVKPTWIVEDFDALAREVSRELPERPEVP